MGTLTKALIAVAAVLFAALVVVGAMLVKTRKQLNGGKSGTEKADKVKIIDGVRYTKDDAVEKNNEINITHNKGDITLLRGKEYTVVKNGEVMPGKYTALSADSETEVFNVRIGGFVRELSHNTPIVLAEGDKICAVSHTVILR